MLGIPDVPGLGAWLQKQPTVPGPPGRFEYWKGRRLLPEQAKTGLESVFNEVTIDCIVKPCEFALKKLLTRIGQFAPAVDPLWAVVGIKADSRLQSGKKSGSIGLSVVRFCRGQFDRFCKEPGFEEVGNAGCFGLGGVRGGCEPVGDRNMSGDAFDLLEHPSTVDCQE